MRQPSTALLLTAGLGTRLRPLTLVRAKPAIPVAGQPMVARIIRWLAAAGVTDVVLNLHALPETIASIVGDGGQISASVHAIGGSSLRCWDPREDLARHSTSSVRIPFSS